MNRCATWAAGWLFWPLLVFAQVPESSAPRQDPPPPLYLQALQAMQQGQTEQAEKLLQAVVAQNPQWAGAWLDLALLAVRQQRYAEADEFLLMVEQKFSPLPPEIAQAVRQLQMVVQQNLQPRQVADVARPARQTAVVMGAGHESNANAGLRLSTITLTLPDGDAVLNVDTASQAKGAAYARAGLVHQATQPWQGGELTWQMQAQTRQYSGLSRYNNIELLPQVSLEHPRLWGQFSTGWQGIWLGNQGTYQTPILRWQLDQALESGCNWRHQLQAEERHFLQAPHLDSHWRAYRGTWQCRSGMTRRQVYIQLAQENAANASRPGGNTRHQSLGLQQEWFRPLGYEGHTLLAKADWLQSRDSGSYNSMLDHGNARRLNRGDLQLTWSAPVANQPDWRWSVSAQNNKQSSNIAFFNQRNFSLETSVWRAW